MTGDLPGVAFRLFAQREQGARKLILPQRKQEITLVLARVGAFLEQGASAVGALFQARKMAGGNVIAAQLPRALEQGAELELLVAHDARIGRAPGPVFLGKISDHLFLEGVRLVDQIIGDTELVADAAGIRHRLRAAAFVFGSGNRNPGGHNFKVMPTTSYPCSSNNAAAAEESTPPLMPHMTRVFLLVRHSGEDTRERPKAQSVSSLPWNTFDLGETFLILRCFNGGKLNHGNWHNQRPAGQTQSGHRATVR